MKKLVLGFIAIVMFGFVGNAQNGVLSKSSMVLLVTQAKSTFSKGTPYKDWLTMQIGNSTIPTSEEDRLLREVYGYLNTNATPEAIYKNYNSSSLIDLAKLNSKGGLTVLGPNAQRCGFWCQLVSAIIIAIGEFMILVGEGMNP